MFIPRIKDIHFSENVIMPADENNRDLFEIDSEGKYQGKLRKGEKRNVLISYLGIREDMIGNSKRANYLVSSDIVYYPFRTVKDQVYIRHQVLVSFNVKNLPLPFKDDIVISKIEKDPINTFLEITYYPKNIRDILNYTVEEVLPETSLRRFGAMINFLDNFKIDKNSPLIGLYTESKG